MSLSWDDACWLNDQPKASLVQGNALALPLADSCVDLVITSPPYFGLRSYQDGGKHYAGQIGSEATPTEFLDALITATAEMIRVLKPSGSIWVNLGDKYASYEGNRGAGRTSLQGSTDRARPAVPGGTGLAGGGLVKNKSLMGLPWRYAIRCVDELGLILRAEVIWSKPNGLPESVTDRVRRSHEQWFHFTTQARYFADLDAIRQPYAPETKARYAAGYSERTIDTERISTNTKLGGAKYGENPLGKLPGSVWSIATQPLKVADVLGIAHFAAFPMEWPRRIVKGWSPVGGVVLDPFGGTGTTAMLATALGRHGISVEMSGDYNRLARWRTADFKQVKRAGQK